jgi:hypothetical protein
MLRTKITTPSSGITKICAGYRTYENMSCVRRSDLIASTVKLIFCGLCPFLENKDEIKNDQLISVQDHMEPKPPPIHCSSNQHLS